MIVTFRTAKCQPQPDHPRRIDSIDDLLGAVQLKVHAGLGIPQCVPMESRGDSLVERRLLNQVARKLFDRELIERQITVDRLNDPLAINPCVWP